MSPCSGSGGLVVVHSSRLETPPHKPPCDPRDALRLHYPDFKFDANKQDMNLKDVNDYVLTRTLKVTRRIYLSRPKPKA